VLFHFQAVVDTFLIILTSVFCIIFTSLLVIVFFLNPRLPALLFTASVFIIISSFVLPNKAYIFAAPNY